MTTQGSTPEKQCLLCGQCLAVCPVFLATGREELSPKAKQHMLRILAEEPQRLAASQVRTLADRCLSCGRCAAACPHRLSVPEVLARLRSGHPLWHQWVWQRWIEQGRLLWPALAQASRLVPAVITPGALKPMLRSAACMLAGSPTAPWVRVERYDDEAGKGNAALLFAGCTARRIRPRWLHTAKATLRGLGFSLAEGRGFTCCGTTLEHAGIPDAAAKARATNVALWRAAGRPVLVTFCATCHHGLAAYPQDDSLGWAEGEREEWRTALRPLSTLWGESAFALTDAAPQGIRYHQPCHWYGADPDLSWLSSVFGTTLSTPDGPGCCGMGGVLQLADPALSCEVADACWLRLLPEGRHAATGDPGGDGGDKDATPAPRLPQSAGAASPIGDGTAAQGACAPAKSPDLAAYPAQAVPQAAHVAPDAAASPAALHVLTGCSGCALQLASTAPRGVQVRHWLDILDAGRPV